MELASIRARLQAQRGLERVDGRQETVRLVEDLRQHGMGIGRVGLVLQRDARGLLGLLVIHLAELVRAIWISVGVALALILSASPRTRSASSLRSLAVQHHREVDVGLDVVTAQADGLAIGMLGLGDCPCRAARRPCCCRPPGNCSRIRSAASGRHRSPRRAGRARAAHCPGCCAPRIAPRMDRQRLLVAGHGLVELAAVVMEDAQIVQRLG